MTAQVLGKGLLADAVSTCPPPMRVVVSDCWDHSGWSQAHDLGEPWIPVWTELNRAVIGPVVRPDEPGCAWCLQRWRDCASEQGSLAAALRAHDRVATEPSHWLTEHACDAVANLLHVATRRDSCLMVDLRDLSVSRRRFLPDPLCAVCGSLPADSPELARIDLQPRPKPSPRTSRVGVLHEPRLTAAYADDETGVVATVTGWNDSPLPMACATLTEYGYRGEAGFGRTRDFTSCRATAIAEALERLGGQWPWGKLTAVRGSYAELSADAVDPRSLGLCPPERYAEPDCPFQPFTEDAVVSWVWAYSFGRGRPVLVPETHAYYRTASQPGADPDKPFTFEISNGCALGGCLEEAILHGILEVVERDAFLMTWHARLPAPEVDLPGAPDRRIPLVAERIERTGYRVRVFDSTLAEALPAFLAVAEDTTGEPDRPRVLCAAGSALDPVGGVLTTLHELAAILDQEERQYAANIDRGRRMAADPALVRTMADHSLCNANPEVYDRFAFLLSGDRRIPWSAVGRRPWPWHADLRDDLVEAVDRMLVGGMDVIVVDQTSPLHRAGGFSCVKVIVPGALPMTFGHGNRRLSGLPRLREVPHRLGYATDPLTDAQLNPHPHPFP